MMQCVFIGCVLVRVLIRLDVLCYKYFSVCLLVSSVMFSAVVSLVSSGCGLL